MFTTITLPLWLFILLVLFATVTALSHFLFPSVRWFFRKRAERVVDRLNKKLTRPIEPFKLARRTDMIQRLSYDPEVTQAIVEHAREFGVREDVAFQKAQRYAREIVPSFSATAYFGIGTRLAKWLATAFYRVRLGHYDETLTEVPRDATVVFVMNHRSNMDYVLVTYLAARASALSYAVGEWAQVWPLSRLIRAMGAYFIRRKSRNALYRRVLARYVQMATRNGVTQAVFPEGGLSLNGALAPPKLGLLNYIVDGFDPDGRDIVFVPVAINYDRVLEDRILIAAGEAGNRKFRARMSVVMGFVLKQLWLWITFRYHRMGYASVSFGQPLSLRDHTATQRGGEIKALGRALMGRIEDVMPVLPVPLVSDVLLAAEAPMTRAAVEAAVADRIDGLQSAHVHLPRDDLGYAVEVGLRQLRKRGLIRLENALYTITPEETHVLRYYARSISHLDDADAA
ncbi:MAG: 1-acyl-sn-glycerol-3-phosphate acyltransferase [Pseudomonadota bacterium]